MNRSRLRFPILFAALAAAFLAAAPAAAQSWAASFGYFNVADAHPPAEGGLEYRFAPIKKSPFVPFAGLAGTEDGNFWAYLGMRLEWEVSESWVITPQVGASFYEDGDGRDLGGPLEFRSGLEFAYRFESGSRLGVVFYHLSNARIYENNPGSNSFALTWSFASR